MNNGGLARRQRPAVDDISLAVFKFLGAFITAKRESFLKHDLSIFQPWSNDEKDGGGLIRFVNEATTDPDRHGSREGGLAERR